LKVPFVDLGMQYKAIKHELALAIEEVFENNIFIQGKEVEEFENSFSILIGVNHCIGVGNGTEALTICLKTLGIGFGDEVIVPANTFIATAEAVTNCGAKVVFVDNHPDTYNIDVQLIEDKINSFTKAIIPVHLYGQPAEMDFIVEIAKKHKLFVIEDGAQSHIAEIKTSDHKWRKTGTFGIMSAFSFYPGKNLGAYGDAGAIVTNDNILAEKARMYANHGRNSKYSHKFEGVNSRMDSIQGAVLNVKLKYLLEWTERRRYAAQYYLEKLTNVREIILPFVSDNVNPVWHLFVIRTNKRDQLKKHLINNNISVGIHYPIGLPNLTAYKYLNHKNNDFPITSSYQNKLLSLPLYPEITRTQQDFVADKITEYFQCNSK